ncbi:hypothetical protein FS837_008036 [Tulasnella sp. UAMH 9824]|nr:hypothetical protein FS837_008036 [Tulasnella sp. UAMH 9824]
MGLSAADVSRFRIAEHIITPVEVKFPSPLAEDTAHCDVHVATDESRYGPALPKIVDQFDYVYEREPYGHESGCLTFISNINISSYYYIAVAEARIPEIRALFSKFRGHARKPTDHWHHCLRCRIIIRAVDGLVPKKEQYFERKQFYNFPVPFEWDVGGIQVLQRSPEGADKPILYKFYTPPAGRGHNHLNEF